VGAMSAMEGWQYAWHISIAISLVFGVLVTGALDMGLHQILLPTLKGFASYQHRKHRKLYGYLLTLSLIMGGSSILISIYCREFVAETVVGGAKTNDVTAAVAAHQDVVNTKVAAIDATITTLLAQQAAAVAKAGTPGLRALAGNKKAEGQGWAEKELEPKQEAAMAKYAPQITAALAAKTAMLNEASVTSERIAADVATGNVEAITRNLNRRHTVAFLQMAISIGGTLQMFISGFGLALLFGAYKLGNSPLDNIADPVDNSAGGGNGSNNNSTSTPPPNTSGNNSNPHNVQGTAQPVITGGTPVITASSPQGPAPQHLKMVAEFDGYRLYEDENGRVTDFLNKGEKMDRTKMKEYANTYTRRATTSSGTGTKELNRDKANCFYKALRDIYGEPEIILPPVVSGQVV